MRAPRPKLVPALGPEPLLAAAADAPSRAVGEKHHVLRET